MQLPTHIIRVKTLRLRKNANKLLLLLIIVLFFEVFGVFFVLFRSVSITIVTICAQVQYD